jgi:hypothetical protein
MRHRDERQPDSAEKTVMRGCLKKSAHQNLVDPSK